MKTLIEIFDECQVENVVSALAYEPEKIIFIGFKNIMNQKKKDSLENFFKLRNLTIDISYEIVSRFDYDDIKQRILDILDRNDDCVLDLTGGKELVLAAMGAVCESRSIPTIQYNIRKGEINKIANCDDLPDPKSVNISINEYIVLVGGAVIKDAADDELFLISDNVFPIIESAWKIRTDPLNNWNSMILSLQALLNMGYENNGISSEIDMRRSKEEIDIVNGYLDAISPLAEAGLITVKNRGKDTLVISHKNEFVHRMFLKAGNIFELYTYICAKKISDMNSDCYNDIRMSVYVDWDGVIQPYGTYSPETINELDVVLIKGALPIFISCKGGELKKEALYELDTVANKFGGEHARKIIVATHISTNERTREVIKQRASDMGIDIVCDADIIPTEKFIDELQKVAK